MVVRYFEKETRIELAKAYHLAAKFNWTDLIYTHISARIPDEQGHFLINPFGLQFHEVTPENLIKVDYDGNIRSETNFTINKAGFNIHSAIHEGRPDLNSVVHLHTDNGMAVSSLQEGLMPITQHACHFYNKIAYHDYEGIVLESSEKKRILKKLQHKKIMILRNHGFLTAGASIAEAFTLMYTLEKAASVQVNILSMGRPINVIPENIIKKVSKHNDEFGIKSTEIEWNAMVRSLGADLHCNAENSKLF
jgi:ribulose-5-phosphate 4-epimerase/fuculose-1-phosphate aldolase